jgi:hypothetical protein
LVAIVASAPGRGGALAVPLDAWEMAEREISVSAGNEANSTFTVDVSAGD